MASRAALELAVELKDNASKQMASIGKEAKNMGDAVEGAGKKSDGIFGKLSGVIGGLPGPMALAGAGAAALGGFLIMATKAAAEEQVGIERLNNTLKNSIPGWKGNTDAIDKYIAKQEKLAFADDQLRDSLGHLVMQTKDLGKAQDLQALAMDLARAKGMDLMDATKLVGKVNDDNIGILARYGISVDKTMSKEQVLAQVRKDTAGQAEGYAKTTAGSMERIQNTFGNIVEDIGGKVMGLIEGPLAGIADFLQSEEFAGIATFLADTIGGGIGRTFKTVGDAIGVLKNVWETDWGGIRTVIETVWNAISIIFDSLGKGLDEIGKIVGGVMELLGLKQADTQKESENFAAAYDKLMGNTATSASNAAGKIATDLPAGFKTAADGSIEQAQRLGTEVTTAIENIKPTPITIEDILLDKAKVSAALSAGIETIELPPANMNVVPVYDPAKGTLGGKDISAQIEEEFMRTKRTANVQIEAQIDFAWMAQASIEKEQELRELALQVANAPIEIECGVEVNPNWALQADSNANLKAKVLASIDAEGVGQSVSEGVALGMSKTYATPLQAVGGMITQVILAAQTALESKSPSKVFERLGEGIAQGLGDGVTGNQAAATGPMGALINAIKGLAQGQLTSAAFSPFGAAVGAGIAGGITSTSGAATGAASAMAGAVKTNVATADDGAFGVGSAIPAGVAAGINAGRASAIGAAASMARGALKAAKDALGIASPSKEFHIMGEDSAEGYIEGWWSKAPEVRATTAAVMTESLDVAEDVAARHAPAYHVMGEDHIAAYEDGWWSGSKSLNMTIDELRHSALGRLAKLPEDDLRAIQDSGGIATDAFKEGVEKGWSSGKGRSLEQIIHDAACGSATKAAQVVDECGELVGGALAGGTARGIDKNIYKAKDAWDAYNKHVVDAHKAAAKQIEEDMAFLAQATIDHLARMESGIIAVGNAVSGANAYTYGAGNGAESPGSTGSGRRVIPQAAGGDWMVRKPTLFLAGEAGPERATFTPVGKAGPMGTVNVYIGTVTTPNAREFVDQLDQELMRSQRLRTAAVGVPG
jgi:hypothetical protein